MHQAVAKDMCHDFIWRLNSLSANFGFCNISTKRQLFMLYSTSFYGVCVWNLQDKYVDEFYTTCARVSGNFLIYLVAPAVTWRHFHLPIQIQIMNRMVRFMQSCLKCNNTSLNMLSRLNCHGVVHICLKISVTYCHNSNLMP